MAISNKIIFSYFLLFVCLFACCLVASAGVNVVTLRRPLMNFVVYIQCFLVAAADFVADTLFANPLSLAARCTLLAHSSVHCAFTFYRSACCCPPPSVGSQQKMKSSLCFCQCFCCCCQDLFCIYCARIDSLQFFRQRLLTISTVHLSFFVCVVVLRCLRFSFLFFSIRARCSHSLHVN